MVAGAFPARLRDGYLETVLESLEWVMHADLPVLQKRPSVLLRNLEEGFGQGCLFGRQRQA